jgi:hypothetical protein
MNSKCKNIQIVLAESGPSAFRDDASAQQHLVNCEDCYSVLTALSELDAALPELPVHDVSDARVDALLARVRGLPLPKSDALSGLERFDQRLRAAARRASEWYARFVASPAAVATLSAACVAVVVLMVNLEAIVYQDSAPSYSDPPSAQVVGNYAGRFRSESETELKKRNMPAQREIPVPELNLEGVEQLRALGYMVDSDEVAAVKGSNKEKQKAASAGKSTGEAYITRGAVLGSVAESETPEIPGPNMEEIVIAGETSSLRDAPVSSTSFSAADLQALRIQEIDDLSDVSSSQALRIRDIADLSKFTPSRLIEDDFKADEAASQKREDLSPAPPESSSMEDRLKRVKRGWAGNEAVDSLGGDARLAGFRFQPASGYWSNAYVPGDPAVRLLESRLNAADREILQASTSTRLRLHDRARQVQQPFDAPTGSAMEVFLHSDRSALEGGERLTLQVGLQGARRQGGARPPMNIGIVLDLRGEISAETATQMRAVVDAFRLAREVGDQFSLRVAGRDCSGVESDRFEYGPLSVAMENCFGAKAAPGQGEAVVAALKSSTQGVRVSDDPDAPLGSSMVLLVTSQSLASDLAALEAIGHESAVAGVPISVAGIGSGVVLGEIDRLILAGQGNRRLVTTSDEARKAVDRELSALSRAVARALRLRIRLAPGVQLIRILDASRLDAEGEERVREAEQSIDLRMANDLGIEADRGEDEDGIQIVIPSFYAGSSHAILLDVVAKEPGPIADVTLRYKDLVYQRNGVARANLNLGGEARTVGPLERNVLKNVMTVRLSSALKSAGDALGAGRVDDAVRALDEQRALLMRLRASQAAFHNDAELATDLDLLDEYLSLLNGEAVGLEGGRRYIANSLQLSGYFKTLPRTRVD